MFSINRYLVSVNSAPIVDGVNVAVFVSPVPANVNVPEIAFSNVVELYCLCLIHWRFPRNLKHWLTWNGHHWISVLCVSKCE